MNGRNRYADLLGDVPVPYEYRELGEGIRISKYLGRCSEVVIPDSIEGKIVIEVGAYAFSGMEFIREVEIPENIAAIGDHCFYDCRNLKLLRLTDHVRRIGNGAFKNCERLHRMELLCSFGRDACIRDILDECHQEIQICIRYPEEESRLIFPDYEVEYFENYSTRPNLFYTEIYGSGQAYRQCLQGGRISYRDYDGLLARSSREDRGPATAGIALLRVLYPMQLTQDRRESYLEYLTDHASDALRWCLEQEREDYIAELAKLNIFRKPEQLKACIEAAQEAEAVECLAVLFAESRKWADVDGEPRPKRRYEL